MELYVLKPGDLASVCLSVAEHYLKNGFISPVVSAEFRNMNWFDVTVRFMGNGRVDRLTVLILNGEVVIQ